ncbi:MAG: NAD(P)-binding domain-containing protein [Chloroflexi bacterium]|nr:NAD(P)-binding domain-containing protein [Chloroflexota bacterium]MCI0579162.1 NAD(P)-binding domain-containing protein [Chloroflexota bacterium]MCI0647943.1 NAD(P)-binding domain-containing protein [Chloroflexota bacterium]MCI0726453.1 NAD(P)-binding domain-containing protein [Chloroflexota bacterium]
MKIGIMGTGIVGQTIAAKLAQIGHEVMIGTRDTAATLAHSEPDRYGNPPVAVWLQQHPTVQLGAFSQAAAHGQLLINATNGAASLDALHAAGEANLNGKILMDISNALDFSQLPPILFVCNTDSLGEQIQRAFPNLKVVKTLNTVTASLMVDPGQLAGGDHHIFVSGNDPEAKAQVTRYLQDWFGWQHVLDLGDITSARAAEMLMPFWLRVWGALQRPIFNVKVVS